MTEVMGEAADAEAASEPLPLLPFSFEAVLADRLRGVSPRRLASLLDRYLFAEVAVVVKLIGQYGVSRENLSLARPPIAETALRFEAAVRAESMPAKAERALLDAADHLLIGEDVVGVLVRIAQRAVRERDLQLTPADHETVLGLVVEGRDTGQVAFEHAVERSGYEIASERFFGSRLDEAVRATFDGLDNDIGFELTEEQRRALITAATDLLARLGPLERPVPIDWLDDRLGSHMARVVLERLRRAKLIKFYREGTVAMPFPS